MNFIFGFIFAILGLVAASIHLQQGLSNYWDFVAFSVVFCGTLSVLIITRPKMKLKTLFQNFFVYLFGNKKNKLLFVKRCFDSISTRSLAGQDTKKIEDKIVVDGFEMIELGFSKEKIEDILADRYLAYKKTIMGISSWIKRCAKYPPAFGLGGTVLGLIHLMKGISAGADPKETGIRMAVALVATFYGLLLSNLVLNPVSEAIIEKLKADEELVEVAIRTVVMAKENYNLIECQETLNSYLAEENEKINFMNAFGNADESIPEAA
jgi:chemotaxis protein MotA